MQWHSTSPKEKRLARFVATASYTSIVLYDGLLNVLSNAELVLPLAIVFRSMASPRAIILAIPIYARNADV